MISRFTRKERKILFLIGTVSCLLLLLWVIFSPKSGLLSHLRLQKHLRTVQVENNDLRMKNQALEEEITRLQNDRQHLEEVSRKKYGLLKKNEVIYRFGKKK